MIGQRVIQRSANEDDTQVAAAPLPVAGIDSNSPLPLAPRRSWISTVIHEIHQERRFPGWTWISFIAVVLVPALIGALYFFFVASDQYQSEMRFGIRSATPVLQDNGLLRGLGVADQSAMDASAVVQFIQSRELIDNLQKEIDIRKIYSRSSIDMFSRFNPSKSIENFEDYLKKQIEAYFETSTGTIVVKVRAFTAEDALLVARGVLRHSEQLVNNLSDRARRDSVKFAETEVERAESRLQKAQEAMRQFRDKQGILDPQSDATGRLTLIAKMRGELSTANAELQSQLSMLSPTAPSIQVLRKRIVALEGEVARLQSEVTSTTADHSKEALSTVIGAYENVAIENKFSEQYYAATLEMLQKARVESERQQKYLAPFVNPSLPEEALYPRRMRTTLMVTLICLTAWVIGMLLVTSIRDHL